MAELIAVARADQIGRQGAAKQIEHPGGGAGAAAVHPQHQDTLRPGARRGGN